MFYPHVLLDLRRIPEAIFRHPCLDFANSHLYAEGAIDDPHNTVDVAIAAGRLVGEALNEIRDARPFFDSEHGPIHTFKDHLQNLPDDFDDEYFRHFQWAHFASGAAGGGMRWPNRKPHQLTKGMRDAQRALAGFLPFLDLVRFRRRNCSAEVRVSSPDIVPFCCADERQALLWLLRRGASVAGPTGVQVTLPAMCPGTYRCVAWDTLIGRSILDWSHEHAGGAMQLELPPFPADLALAVSS